MMNPMRGSWSLQAQKAHLVLGSVITAATVLLPVIFRQQYWAVQAVLVSSILKLAKIPHSLLLPGSRDGIEPVRGANPTFLIDIAGLSETAILAIVAVAILAVLVIVLIPRFSPPFKIVLFFFLALVLVNVAYEVLHHGPPMPLQVDWLTSGIVIIPLITLMLNFTLFPIPGGLLTKLAGLFGCLFFSFAWSTLRFSLALASLFHLGTASYMFLEYVPGAFLDFVYVLLFYSLVMYQLTTARSRQWRGSR